jgi:hypothetical protein
VIDPWIKNLRLIVESKVTSVHIYNVLGSLPSLTQQGASEVLDKTPTWPYLRPLNKGEGAGCDVSAAAVAGRGLMMITEQISKCRPAPVFNPLNQNDFKSCILFLYECRALPDLKCITVHC